MILIRVTNSDIEMSTIYEDDTKGLVAQCQAISRFGSAVEAWSCIPTSEVLTEAEKDTLMTITFSEKKSDE